jgi:hypothetical protein
MRKSNTPKGSAKPSQGKKERPPGDAEHHSIWVIDERVYVLRPGKNGGWELVHYSDEASAEDHPLSWDELALLRLMGLPIKAAGQPQRKIPAHLITSISGRLQALINFAQDLKRDPGHVLTKREVNAPLAAALDVSHARELCSRKDREDITHQFLDDMGPVRVRMPPLNGPDDRTAQRVASVAQRFTTNIDAVDCSPLERAGRSASLRGNPFTLVVPPPYETTRITEGTFNAVLCLMQCSDARNGNYNTPWGGQTVTILPVRVSMSGDGIKVTEPPYLGALPDVARGMRKMGPGDPPQLLQVDWAARNVSHNVLAPPMRAVQCEGNTFAIVAEDGSDKGRRKCIWNISSEYNVSVSSQIQGGLDDLNGGQPGGVHVFTVRLTTATAVSLDKPSPLQESKSQPGNTGSALAALQVFFLILHHVRCNDKCRCFLICSHTTVVSKTSMLQAIMTLHVWPEKVNEWLCSNVPAQTSVKSPLASFASASQAGGGNMQKHDESVVLWQELSSCVIGARNVLDVLCFLLIRIANCEASSPGHGAFTGINDVIGALENELLSGTSRHRKNENHDCTLGVTFPFPDNKTKSANLLQKLHTKLTEPKFNQHIQGMVQPGMA